VSTTAKASAADVQTPELGETITEIARAYQADDPGAKAERGAAIIPGSS
jgi:hypothetical protein